MMQELVYPWKRFWCPRGGQISLADDGFLLDPDSEYANYYPSDVVAFESISHAPCMVLLGEPGIGKSTALKTEFENSKKATSRNGGVALWFDLRDYSSDDRLERKVFKCDAIQTWRSGLHTLDLFLDSLDEALLRIDNISRVLLSEFEDLPTERLRLRIASRPADWQVTLEDGFAKIWGESKVRVFELAPLRKADVACAAKLSGIDPSGPFIETIIRRDVVPLAIKPVTLELLIGAFAKGGNVPATRAELYFEGCKRLCDEPNRHRLDSLIGRGRLAASQRLAIAARLAAVTQLSNRAAIWIGPERAVEAEDVPQGTLIGGTEGELSGEVAVDLTAVREVLGTGLFSTRGLGRQGWRHQTFAEYLAAYYLNFYRIPLERLQQVILHPDGSGKVIPQLRETAAWLAGMNPQVFQLLVRSDAEVLLRSDMGASSHGDRASLAKRLLESFESGDITQSLWDIRKYFDRLENPELANATRPYISEICRPRDARIAAIEMVRACRLTDLQGDLVAVALDPNEVARIRFHAAAAVAEIGDPSAQASLRPLAFGSAGDDAQDDLKGYGLIATWPRHITPQELFSALTPVKADHYHGAYRQFLNSGIAGKLDPKDMVTAVTWARQHARRRDGSDDVHKLASDILKRAIDHIDQPPVLDLLAAALFERAQIYTDCDGITAKLRASGNSVRRAVARAMFPAAAAEKHGAFLMMDVCAMGAQDVRWLLSELSRVSDGDDRRTIAEVISRTVDPEDIDSFDAVVTAALVDGDLRAAIGWRVGPVHLGTPLAERMKADYEVFIAHQQPKSVAPNVSIAQSLSEIVADNNPQAFFRVDWLLRNHEGHVQNPAEPLPGWSELGDDLRTRILSTARKYLKTRPPSPGGAWWKDGKFSAGMMSGYSALHLLAAQSPDSLDGLADGDWEFWTSIIITYLVNGSDLSSRSLLIAKAYKFAKSTFLSTIDEVIDGENERHQRVFVIDHIGEVWSDELAAMLRAKIAGRTLKPESFKVVLAKLLKMGDVDAKVLARTMATGTIPDQGENRRRTVFATAELISHDPREWNAVWPVFQANEAFGIEVLQVVAFEHEYTSFVTVLPEGDIADICIWLSRLGLEKAEPDHSGLVTPPVALAHWWNTLINFLTYKGTVNACHAIRRLIDALPQYSGLQGNLKEAEERTRRATWIPLSPKEIIRLVVPNAIARLVISLHGIRTRGAWQKTVNSELQRNGFRHELLDYGFFSALQFLMPWRRAQQIAWFRGEYETLVREAKIIPSVIAHSFGTYIVANALEKYAELRFDRIILCGSIVRRDYDWDSLIKSGRIKALLNEYASGDIWVELATTCVVDAGASGTLGFQTLSPLVYQRLRPRFRHSDYFYPLNYRDNWIPFLTGAEPSEHLPERKPQPNWRFCIAVILALAAVLTAVLVAAYLLQKTG